MSTETERLEREAEQHRSRVDSTLDQLRESLSLGQIVDELSTYVRHGQGADTVRNLGRQVRDNPLALGLMGAGFAWLLMGEGVKTEGQELWPGSRSTRSRSESDSEDRQSAGDFYGTGSTPFGDDPLASGSAVDESGEGMFSKAKDRASRTASGISDTVSGAGEAFSGSASSAGRHASDTMHAARRRTNRMGHDAYDAGRHAGRSLSNAFMQEPLIMGAIAVAIGAAVGAALPPTEREDELFGETRDRVRDQAYEYGEEAVDRGKDVAMATKDAAMEAGKDAARDTGLAADTDSTPEEESTPSSAQGERSDERA